jgi:hypothetical protein
MTAAMYVNQQYITVYSTKADVLLIAILLAFSAGTTLKRDYNGASDVIVKLVIVP